MSQQAAALLLAYQVAINPLSFQAHKSRSFPELPLQLVEEDPS